MPPDPCDRARLWDMLDATHAASDFVKDMKFETFVDDRKTRNAVERNLEIIGEAARGVSSSTREAYPVIPWRAIIGLRNIIAHEYGAIRHENIWRICVNRLPALIKALESMNAGASPPSDDSTDSK